MTKANTGPRGWVRGGGILTQRLAWLMAGLVLSAHWVVWRAAPACRRRLPRPESRAIAAPADAPLPTPVRELAIPERLSAVRPMPLAQDALTARLAMIAQARTAIDVQTYHLADAEHD